MWAMRLLIRSIISPLSGGYCSSSGGVLQLLGKRFRIRHRFVAGITTTDIGSRPMIDHGPIIEQPHYAIFARRSACQHERRNVLLGERLLQGRKLGAL